MTSLHIIEKKQDKLSVAVTPNNLMANSVTCPIHYLTHQASICASLGRRAAGKPIFYTLL